MYLVAGNIIVQRGIAASLHKVPIENYDQRSYINLFQLAKEWNQPHFDRIHEIFKWIDDGQKLPLPDLVKEIKPLVKLKAKPTDPKELNIHWKKLYLSAYNEFYDMVYLPQDIGLDK